MIQKALMAMPQVGPALFSNPLKQGAGERTDNDAGLTPASFAISASLTVEDDFELSGEFLDVFVRAGERIAGFIAGCMVAAAIWMIYAAVWMIYAAMHSG